MTPGMRFDSWTASGFSLIIEDSDRCDIHLLAPSVLRSPTPGRIGVTLHLTESDVRQLVAWFAAPQRKLVLEEDIAVMRLGEDRMNFILSGVSRIDVYLDGVHQQDLLAALSAVIA